MATIRDVARLAGVSSGTVSNVLNRPSYVNSDTRARVLRVISELDFVPNQQSRQFRPGRTRTIGIAVAELNNPFFVDVALGAENVCREQDLGVVLTNSSYDPQIESQNLDLLVQQRVQGIIISPVSEKSSRIALLKDRGVPMVFVDRVGDDRDVWSVVIDDKEGGRIGARHLIHKGHNRIAFLGHPHMSPKVQHRFEGASEIIDKAARQTNFEIISAASWTFEEGRRCGAEIAKRVAAQRPTAVLCANDMLALGFVQELSRAGIQVPGDIAVVGYDDIEWASIGAVPLTTVAQPRELLGRTAVEMIMHLIDRSGHLPLSNHIVLAPELVVRDSA